MIRRMRAMVAAAVFVAALGCSHNQPPDGEDTFIPAPPVPVHVKNENFLDCNVFVVISGVSRRLGTVTGNAAADFVISYGLSSGQTLYLTAQPIGGRGGVNSPSLTVAPGQMIDFRIGSVLRQSTATVHDP